MLAAATSAAAAHGGRAHSATAGKRHSGGPAEAAAAAAAVETSRFHRRLRQRLDDAVRVDDADAVFRPAVPRGPWMMSSPAAAAAAAANATAAAAARHEDWRRLGPVLRLQRWARAVLARRRVHGGVAGRRAWLRATLEREAAEAVQRCWRAHRLRRQCRAPGPR